MFDDLLMWCSERGSGSLAAFQETYSWLADRHGLRQGAPPWGIALYNLSVLGHVEVDWTGERWGTAPPVLTTLVGSGGYALLVGERPLWLQDRLDSLMEDKDPAVAALADSVVPQLPVAQRGGPSVQLIAVVDEADARRFCDALKIRFERRAAEQLALRLPKLQDMIRERGIEYHGPAGLSAQRMSDGGSPQWTDVDDTDAGLDGCDGSGIPLHGAYRYQRFRTYRYVYWLRRRGFEADKRAVIYAELARAERWVLRYDSVHQALYAPATMQLPVLHARAAVLRTGLLPQLHALPDTNQGPDHVKYANISPSFAHLLADSLYQQLQYVPSP